MVHTPEPTSAAEFAYMASPSFSFGERLQTFEVEAFLSFSIFLAKNPHQQTFGSSAGQSMPEYAFQTFEGGRSFCFGPPTPVRSDVAERLGGAVFFFFDFYF